MRDHLDGWTRDELANASDAVSALLESDAWVAIERSIEDRLKFEQRLMMTPAPAGDDEVSRARYERSIGQWAGLRQVRAIAEGLVEAGKQAERDMRVAA
jgi:hypothetical protein